MMSPNSIKSTSVFCFLFTLGALTSQANASRPGNEDMDEELRKIALKNGIDPDNPKPGTVFITPPKLSDEEQGSQFIPKAHRCDACHIIAYQLKKRFEVAERKVKKGKALSDAEILTVTDDLCEDEFKNYGLKNIQGLNKLSGEGLKSDKMSGMVETGGKWMKRLQNICKEIMGDYEEEMVYMMYRASSDKNSFGAGLCSKYCDGARHLTPVNDEL